MEMLPETLCLLYNLQILDLNSIYLRELPENIKNLINLRYFHLRSNRIQQLPESIFLLRNLHTLSLRCCPILQELPRGIEQLTRLRVLDLPSSLIYMPYGIGKLTTLNPLSGDFNVMDHGMIGGLGELKDMNKLSGLLCITGLRNISDVKQSREANLLSKTNLRKLILNFQEDRSMLYCREKHHFHLTVISNKKAKNENDEKKHDVVLQSLQPPDSLTELAILKYEGLIFPSWLLNPLLPKLTTLTLNFSIEPNFLPPFGQLPYLRFLEISGSIGVRNMGDELSTYSLLAEYGSSKQPREPSYPSLEVLSLWNMLNLVEWQAHDGDFPCLEQLTIENCPKLWKIAKMPPVVREVTFKYCPTLKLLSCPSVIKRLTIHECGFREIMFGPILESVIVSKCVELISINWSHKDSNSVREVSFEYCPKLELIIIPVGTLKLKIHECGFREIMFQSVSKYLTVSNCTELILINWMDGGLNSVEEVSFKYCPKLKLPTIPTGIKKLKIAYCGIQEIMFPLQSSTQIVDVFHCPVLTSIHWVKRERVFHTNLLFEDRPELPKGLKNLRISNCPILQFPVKERAEIYDCPRLYLGKRYVYQRDPRIKEFNLLGDNGINLSRASVNYSTIPLLEKPFNLSLTKEDFLEEESLTSAPLVGVSCECLMLNLASLVILEILRCRKVISVTGLDNLSNLKRLSISYCPELFNWNDKTLPLSLEFLKLDSCDKLSSLPLLSVQNRLNTLNVLSIIKCPRLAVLEGFHGLMNLKTVELLHCRNISISPATESLQFRPRINIGDCPLMRDWCQRNNITYCQLNPIDNHQDDREAEQEGAGATTKD